MILGMTVGAFVIGVVWPIANIVFSAIIAFTNTYEGKKAETELGSEFEMWYYTF